MFDLTTYVKKWQIRQLKTVFSTLDTLCGVSSQRRSSRVAERQVASTPASILKQLGGSRKRLFTKK